MSDRHANDLAVRMYMHGILQKDVAAELGVTHSSVSMTLNGKRGKRDPAAALAKISDAVDAIIARRRSA